MKQPESTWLLATPPGEDPADLVPHVVSRIGTALQTTVDRYDGARVHQGNIVFGAAHRSHLVSVVLGPDVDSGQLAVRLVVTGNVAARWAVLAFPAVLLATICASVVLIGGRYAAAGGLVVGTLLGSVAAYGAFVAVRRFGIGAAEDRGGAERVGGLLTRPLRSSLGSMGIDLEPGDARLAGFDAGEGDGRGADERWNRRLADALGSLT